MSRTLKSTDKPKPKPIYPPNRTKALIYWTLSFVSFFAAASLGDFLMIILTGITLAASSSFLGEQLYKEGIYKEILYNRALETMISVEEVGDGNKSD